VTDAAEPKTPKKRRTRAEVRADLEAQLKEIAAEEKAEVVRKIAHIHDDLVSLMEEKQMAPLKLAVTEMVAKAKAVLAAAEKA